MKMLGKVDEHLFRTRSGRPGAAFDGRLCHRPIKQFPVPFINVSANDSGSPQSISFQTDVAQRQRVERTQCSVKVWLPFE